MRMLLCLLGLVCLLGGFACGDSGNPPPVSPDGQVDIGVTADGGAGDQGGE